MTQVCHALFALLLASAALAETTAPSGPAVVVIGLDGRRTAGELVALTPNTVRLVADGMAQALACDEVARIEFTRPAPAVHHARDYVLHLADGGTLGADMLDVGDDGVIVQTQLAERMVIPFGQLAAIEQRKTDLPAARQLLAEAMANRLPGKDILITADAAPKAIRGALISWGPVAGKFVFGDRAREFQTARTHGVVLAAGTRARVAPADVTITLADGEQFTATAITVVDNVARAATQLGVEAELDPARLGSVAWTNSRVVYLSDLDAAAYHHAGIIHTDWPYRRDRNVFNGPLMLGGRAYAKGLGMHAESELTYTVEGAYETFAATIGIDDAASAAGMVAFYVLGDGTALFASGPVGGDAAPRDIQIPVSGVRSLTLRVAFGENADVGDWANWASARLIRPKEGIQ